MKKTNLVLALAIVAGCVLVGCKSADEASTEVPKSTATPVGGGKGAASAAPAGGMTDKDLGVPAGANTAPQFGAKAGGK